VGLGKGWEGNVRGDAGRASGSSWQAVRHLCVLGIVGLVCCVDPEPESPVEQMAARLPALAFCGLRLLEAMRAVRTGGCGRVACGGCAGRRWSILRPSGRLCHRRCMPSASWPLLGRRRRAGRRVRGSQPSRGGRLTGRGRGCRPRLSEAFPVRAPQQGRRRADVHLGDPARPSFLCETAQPLLAVGWVLLPAKSSARPRVRPAVGTAFRSPELLVAAARMHGIAAARRPQVACPQRQASVVTERSQQ